MTNPTPAPPSARPSTGPNPSLTMTSERSPAGSGAGVAVWPDPPPAADPAGMTFGPYRAVRELGRGGMGVVYEAVHAGTGQVVAVKVIRGVDEFGLCPLRAEFDLMSRLDHANVLRVFPSELAGPAPYIVMEFAAGGSLDKRLARKPQPARWAAAAVQTLAEAVAYLHAKDVVHRDLKPQNVLVTMTEGQTEFQRLRVADLGLAKQLRGAAELSATRAGAGTLAYMAPEQIASGRNLTPSVDVYALGVILYEMLTGRTPFYFARAENTPDGPPGKSSGRGMVSDLADFIRQVQWTEPPAPSALGVRVPRALETVCLKCLRKSPAGRYATAADLAADLGRWLNGEPVLARRTPPWERAALYVRRRPWQAGAAGTAAFSALAVGALVATIWADHAAQQRREEKAATEQARREELAGKDREFREKLQAQHRASLKALGDIRDLVLTGDLSKVGGLNPLNQKLGAYYQQLLDGDAADLVGSRKDLAAAAANMGELFARTGGKPEALEAYQRAAEMYRELADTPTTEAADRPGFVRSRAAARLRAADLLSDLGRYDEASAAYDDAGAALDADPDPVARRLAAEVWHQRGVNLNRQQKYPEARAAYEEGLRRRRAALDADPHGPGANGWRRDLARSYGYLGDVLMELGRMREADRAYWDSHAVRKELKDGLDAQQAAHPNDAKLRGKGDEAEFQLARSHANFANFQIRNRAPRTAADYLRQAAELQKALVQSNPNVTEYQLDLGDATSLIADLAQADASDPRGRADARAGAKRAVDLFQQLRGRDQADVRFRRGLAVAQAVFAQAAADDPASARAAADARSEARTLLDGLRAADDPHPRTAFYHAAVLALAGRPEAEVVEALRKATTGPHPYREKHPDDIADYPAFRTVKDGAEFRRLIEELKSGPRA